MGVASGWNVWVWLSGGGCGWNLLVWLGIIIIVITLGNLPSFPSSSCLVHNYDTMIMQFYYGLVFYYIHALINATCAGRSSRDKSLTFDVALFSNQCVHLMHAKVFSIEMLQYFSQIVRRVCTLVLFINPRCTCTARVTVVVLCVRVCVHVSVM